MPWRPPTQMVVPVRDGVYAPMLHDMRRLVLRWPGYDQCFESSRGWYTVELINASPYAEELIGLVIRHLSRTKGIHYHRRHREAVVFELAMREIAAAKEAIYACFDPAVEFRLSREIVELDRLTGLDWLLSHSIGALGESEGWLFSWWLEDLREACGEHVVSEWLDRESASRPEVAEFVYLVSFRPPRAQPTSVRPTFEALREMWREEGEGRPSVSAWVRSASEEELTDAWLAFVVEDDRSWLYRLAKALSQNPGRADVDRVIARVRSWEDEQNPFVMALEKVVDPRLRPLGLELIERGWIVDGVDLLTKHALPGDEATILAAIVTLTDDWDVHSVGLDVMNLDGGFDIRELLLWTYENTPCSFCRESAVRGLLEIGRAPPGLLEECQFDCVEDTRKMVEGAYQ